VDQSLTRHPNRIVLKRLLIGADCNALQQIEDHPLGVIHLPVFRPLDQDDSEHWPKETTLLQEAVRGN
jgi:hypothetical protein